MSCRATNEKCYTVKPTKNCQQSSLGMRPADNNLTKLNFKPNF